MSHHHWHGGVRIVTGKNSMRHTMRDAVLDVRVLADILDHMPVA